VVYRAASAGSVETWIGLMKIFQVMPNGMPLNMRGGSGRRGTQLRDCPPPFGLLLYVAALRAPSARSCVHCWYLKCADYRRRLPRVMRWVAQRGLGVLPNQGGAHRAGDIRGIIHCRTLGLHTQEMRCSEFR
jgi:hypothetical protein